MKIRFKVRALRHLEAIHEYVAAHDPGAAKRVVSSIQHSISRLEFLPLSGRPGIIEGTRILVVPNLPYVVIHRVGRDSVDIIAILHTARRHRR